MKDNWWYPTELYSTYSADINTIYLFALVKCVFIVHFPVKLIVIYNTWL